MLVEASSDEKNQKMQNEAIAKDYGAGAYMGSNRKIKKRQVIERYKMTCMDFKRVFRRIQELYGYKRPELEDTKNADDGDGVSIASSTEYHTAHEGM